MTLPFVMSTEHRRAPQNSVFQHRYEGKTEKKLLLFEGQIWGWDKNEFGTNIGHLTANFGTAGL